MQDLDLVQTRRLQRRLQRIRYIGSRHGRAQLPGQNVAREVVEHGGQVEPVPADDLEVGEVGLPKLVGRGRRIGEAIVVIVSNTIDARLLKKA